MPDNSLDILIRTLADTHGAEAVKKSIDDVTGSTKKITTATAESSKVTEEHTTKVHGLKNAFGFLTRQLGELGHVAHFLFFSTLSGGLIAVGLVVGRVVEHFQKIKEVTEALAKGVPQDLKTIEDAVEDVRQKNNELKESVKPYEDAVKESTANAIAALRSEKEAILEVLNARAALAIASGADEEATRKKLDDMKAEFELQEKTLTLIEKRNQQAATEELLLKRSAEASKNLGGLTPEQAKESIAFLNESGKGLQQQIAKLEQTREKAGLSERPGIDWRISALRQLQSRDTGRVRTLGAGIAASEEAEGLRTRFNQGQSELGRLEQSGQSGATAARLRSVRDLSQNAIFVTPAGTRVPSNMKSETDALVQALAESKLETQKLLLFLGNIFKDGFVTKQELVALRQAVANARRP